MLRITDQCKGEGILRRLAVCAVIPMMVSPLLQLIHNIVSPERDLGMFGREITYPDTIQLVNSWATAFVLVAWVLLVLQLIQQKTSKKELIWKAFFSQVLFLCLVLWAFMASIIGGNTEYLTEGYPLLSESMKTFTLYFAGYFMCGMVLTNDQSRRVVLLVIVCTGALLGTVTLINQYVVSLVPPLVENGVCAVFYNPNHYAYFVTICILLSAVMVVLENALWIRIVGLYSFICNSIVLNANDTLGSYLAVLFALAVMTLIMWINYREEKTKERKRFLWGSIFLLCAFVLIMLIMSLFYNTILRSILVMLLDIGKIVSDDEDAWHAGSGRWRIWGKSIEFIMERPLLGYGVDGIAARLESFTGFTRSHNEYLQYTAFWGIPSLLIYLSACGCTLFRSWKERFSNSPCVFAAWISSVGYMVSAFFGNTKYYTSPYFFVVLGIVASGVVETQNKKVTGGTVSTDKGASDFDKIKTNEHESA